MLKYINLFDKGAEKYLHNRFYHGHEQASAGRSHAGHHGGHHSGEAANGVSRVDEMALVYSPVLVVGARLGGEVRAFQAMPQVQLAIGVDVAPGKDNKYVMFGDAHSLDQFKNGTFGTLYCNVVDHILYIDMFGRASRRVLRAGGTLFVDFNHQSLKDDSLAVHDLIAERPEMVRQILGTGFEQVHQYVCARLETEPAIRMQCLEQGHAAAAPAADS
jgi:hypothetical protein